MHQSYAGGSVSDTDEESPPDNRAVVSYAPSTNTTTSFSDLTAKANATSSEAGVHLRLDLSNKTPPYAAHPPYFETVGRSLMINKQQSLDLSSSSAVSEELRPLNTAPANYYTEIKSDDTNDELDVSPPKIARLNSAPVYGLSRTAPCTPADFAATPIINFDFTKGLAASYVQPYQPTAFVKIDYNPAAAASASSLTAVPRINVNVLTKNNNSPVMPTPAVNYSRGIVVQNAPTTTTPANTKLNYNHVIDMRTSSSSTSSSSSSSTVVPNTQPIPLNARPVKDFTKVPAPRGRPPKPRFAPQTPAASSTQSQVIDLTDVPSSSSSFTVAVRAASSSPSTQSSSASASSSVATKANGFTLPAPPTFYATSATSSCLDMDEDYDTI